MITASIKNNVLTIQIPVQKPVASATGKSLTVASSRGNQKTDVLVDGKPLIIGVNAYIKPSL